MLALHCFLSRTHIRSEITVLFNEIQALSTHIANVEANLQTQINEMNAVVWENRDRINGLQGRIESHDEDIDGLLNHVNTVDNHLQNQINDLNVRTPQKCRISIPAASFVPVGDTLLINHGHKLENSDPTYAAQAIAGIQLPEGAIIKQVVGYFFNTLEISNPAVLSLYKNDPNIYPQGYPGPQGYTEIVRISSSTDRGYYYGIYNLNYRVDNSYSYYLALTLTPQFACNFSQATIHYEYPT